ncbi:MAG: glycosyltransferase family 4 protein [Pseudomonadota bacterium]
MMLTALGLGPLRALLQRCSVIDMPNWRRSHRHPTPRGGGWVMVPVALVGFAVAQMAGGESISWPLIIGAVGLMVVSGIDDVRSLSPWPRLVCQAMAVFLVLALLPADQRLFSGIPIEIERLVIGLAWLWYVNLFNFMDGLDGLSAVEILSVGAGVAVIAAVSGGVAAPYMAGSMVDSGLVLVGIACGFMIWNWHPARLFMGDVGSIPFGFLLGWILLSLAYDGQWVEAVLLSLFHLTDASTTLASRLMRGERVWQAHCQHAYQQPVRAGWTHDRVVGIVAAVKSALVALAIAVAAGVASPLPTLGIAILMVVGVILGFHRTSLPYDGELQGRRALSDLSDGSR